MNRITGKSPGRADRKQAPKYVPVTVAPVPATWEETECHVRAFIASFIKLERRSRWAHCVLASREKASGHLHRFGHDHEGGRCAELEGADGFPLALEDRYGSERGLYFDGVLPPCRMTAAEAATKTTEEGSDALLSFVAGSRALFFHHEGRVWRCES